MSFPHLSNLAGKKFGKISLEKQIRKGTIGVIYEGLFDLEKVAFMQCDFAELAHLRFKIECKSFTNGTILKISRQILDGLSHIHEKGYTHRDTKLNNMMVSQSGGCSQKVVAFLIDFGISSRVVDKNGNRMSRDTCFNFSKLDQSTPYTALGDAPDFIDDLIQMTYSMIRVTNDPMKEQKAIPLHRPRTVLSVTLSWMVPFFEPIGSQKPLSSIDYQSICGSVDAMIPENDARADLNLRTVGKEFKLI
ncbi:hypothetical protein CAEBREN_01363 [Caenorhabditis brenneri]|uniref:Protein kinase domain-containing protein n=1 Tax=Caenorhabditis brenneri TaxID=135651 RepID=G0P1G6_CAEBE|nr:hypothetical protein CAEBREN_01363 [Caenorhabditis brenneri]